ncbi:MAG: DUF2059 domain-containing protein [Terriglobales bacterium]
MKRLLVIFGLFLAFSWPCIAQTNPADAPATKADVERYFQAVQSHDMMKKMMAAMTQSMHQMFHEQYLKHKDELPADYESKMNADMDSMFENMPMDEMMQAMVPAFQKHLTKGDIDNLVAFYATPTGQKLLREMPSMMAESMQDMMPIMTKYIETVKQTLLKKTEAMMAESKKSSDVKTPATSN